MDMLFNALGKGRAAYAETGISDLLSEANSLKSQIRYHPEKALLLILIARKLAEKGSPLLAASYMAVASLAVLRIRKLAQPSAQKLAEDTAYEYGTFIDKTGLRGPHRTSAIKKTSADAPEDSPLAQRARQLQSDFMPAVPTGQPMDMASAPVVFPPNAPSFKTIRTLRAIEEVGANEPALVIEAPAPQPDADSIIPPFLARNGLICETPNIMPHEQASIASHTFTSAAESPAAPSADRASPFNPQKITRHQNLWADFREAAGKTVKRVIDGAPAFFAGAAVGSTIRIGGGVVVSHFALAALAATAPAAVVSAAAIGSALVLGAAAGGAANVIKTWGWGTEAEKQGNWKRVAFMNKKALVLGAIGSLVGFGIADHFQGGSALKNLFHHSTPPVPVPVLPVAVPVAHEIVHHLPPVTVFHPVPDTAPFGVDKILSPAELARHHISPDLLKMMSSHDPETLMRACKEISYHLFNDAPTNPAKGVEFLQRGLYVFGHADPHTRAMVNLAQQMHADLAFEKYKEFLKTGNAAFRDAALDQAKLARHAMHNYQERLLEQVGKIVSPNSSPAALAPSA